VIKKFNTAHVLLEKHLKELGLAYRPEARFHEKRLWRFDYLLYEASALIKDDLRVAIEIEGAIWSRGRHTRGKGFEEDCIKYDTATMMGYRVLRFSTQQVLRGTAKAFLKEWLCKS